MKLATQQIIIAAVTSVAITGCFDSSTEEDIEFSKVPADIIGIVQDTLPGISLHEAEKKTKNDRVVYELEGKLLSGEEYEIKIADDGTIIKVELED